MSRAIKPIHMMEVDRRYPVERVERLARCHSRGEKHFLLTVLEGSRKEFYVLPLDDFFSQNEIIMVNNRSMYLDVLLRGIDVRGNPILVVSKRNK
jgi:hypothetical protein